MGARGDGSRWDRWSRWPWQLLGWVCMAAYLLTRFVSADSTAGQVLTAVMLPVVVFGAILTMGPRLHRGFRATQEDARRNPTGARTETMDDRLAGLSHPRLRWLQLATFFALAIGATGWLLVLAARRDDSTLVGLAIPPALPAILFGWVTWRTRALLTRPTARPATPALPDR